MAEKIEKRARELPVVARLYERRTARCTYRRASVTSAEGEPLVRLADAQAIIAALTPPSCWYCDGQAMPVSGDAWETLRREWAIDGMPADKQRLARAAFAAGAASAVNGSTMVNMGDSEAAFIADGDRLDCRSCGGSGHADDASLPPIAPPAPLGEVGA